jgi:hypothetical protein
MTSEILCLHMIHGYLQYQVGEVFSFKFELAIKGILITSVEQLLRKKTQL